MTALSPPPGFGAPRQLSPPQQPRQHSPPPQPQQQVEKPKRSMKRRVSWANGENLIQIRLFVADEAVAMSGSAQDQLQAKPTRNLHIFNPSVTLPPPDAPPGFGGVAGKSQADQAAAATVVPQVAWKPPSPVVLDATWHVMAGGASLEIAVQKQRELRILEAVYPRPSSIPESPGEPLEAQEAYDDSVTPQIPLVPLEEEDNQDGSDPSNLSSSSRFPSLGPSSQGSGGMQAMSSSNARHERMRHHGGNTLPGPMQETPNPRKDPGWGNGTVGSTARLVDHPSNVMSGRPSPAAGPVPTPPNHVQPGPKQLTGVVAQPDVAAATAAAFAALSQSQQMSSMIDNDLLIQILNDPSLIHSLQAKSPFAAPTNPKPELSSIVSHNGGSSRGPESVNLNGPTRGPDSMNLNGPARGPDSMNLNSGLSRGPESMNLNGGFSRGPESMNLNGGLTRGPDGMNLSGLNRGPDGTNLNGFTRGPDSMSLNGLTRGPDNMTLNGLQRGPDSMNLNNGLLRGPDNSNQGQLMGGGILGRANQQWMTPPSTSYMTVPSGESFRGQDGNIRSRMNSEPYMPTGERFQRKPQGPEDRGSSLPPPAGSAAGIGQQLYTDPANGGRGILGLGHQHQQQQPSRGPPPNKGDPPPPGFSSSKSANTAMPPSFASKSTTSQQLGGSQPTGLGSQVFAATMRPLSHLDEQYFKSLIMQHGSASGGAEQGRAVMQQQHGGSSNGGATADQGRGVMQHGSANGGAATDQGRAVNDIGMNGAVPSLSGINKSGNMSGNNSMYSTPDVKRWFGREQLDNNNAGGGRPERPERPDRPERLERPERPERPDRNKRERQEAERPGGPGPSGGGSDNSKPRSKSRKVCIYFGTAKGCRNGDNCSFVHDPNESQQKRTTDRARSAPSTLVPHAKRLKVDG